MKTTFKIVLFLILMTGCVQKASKRIVVVSVDVSKIDNVKSVGIRGNGKPLSWETDLPMHEIVKDSLYRGIINTTTGYLFTECKFTVNGNFELQNQANRRIIFDNQKDTTKVNFVFDKL